MNTENFKKYYEVKEENYHPFQTFHIQSSSFRIKTESENYFEDDELMPMEKHTIL